jgi:hypothetical protein
VKAAKSNETLAKIDTVEYQSIHFKSTVPSQLQISSPLISSSFRVIVPLAQPLLLLARSQHIQHASSPFIASPITNPTSSTILMAIAETFLLTQRVLSALAATEIKLLGYETP